MASYGSVIGNGTGKIYITKGDGTSIISSLPNTRAGVMSAQAFMASSSPYHDQNTTNVTAFRAWVYANGSAADGALGSSVEITDVLRSTGLEGELTPQSDTIASGYAKVDRKGFLNIVSVTEEGSADDTLEYVWLIDKLDTTENISVNGDIIIVKKATATKKITVANTGNIVLDDDANFEMDTQYSDQIALQYNSSTAKWHELFRTPNAGYGLTKLRAAGLPIAKPGSSNQIIAAQGVVLSPIIPGVDEHVIQLTSSASRTLTGPVTVPIPSTTGAIAGDVCEVIYGANINIDGNADGAIDYQITLFGKELTIEEASSGEMIVRAIYGGDTWAVTKISSLTGSNTVTSTMIKTDAVQTAGIKDLNVTQAKISKSARAGVDFLTTNASLTTSGTSIETLATYSLPASQVGTSFAKGFRVTVYGLTSSASNNRQIHLVWGDTVVYETDAFTSASDNFKLVVDVFVRDASNVDAYGVLLVDDGAVYSVNTGTASKASTSAVDILLRATTATGGSLTVNAMYVEVLPSYS
jgi:hypothetical protein